MARQGGSPRKLFGHKVILLAVLGVLAVVGYVLWPRGVYVSIANNTDDALAQVSVTYTGGVMRVASLEPKRSWGRYVNPDGESDLTIEWTDSSGAKQSHPVDVYIEHNYRGRVEITVELNNTVSVTDKVRLKVL